MNACSILFNSSRKPIVHPTEALECIMTAGVYGTECSELFCCFAYFQTLRVQERYCTLLLVQTSGKPWRFFQQQTLQMSVSQADW